MNYIISIACVLGISIGQLLFKAAALESTHENGLFSPKPILLACTAVLLYGITSIVWIWILRSEQLGKIYPVMALAFVFVPLGSHFVFGEKFGHNYMFGLALIVAGIAMTNRN
ncbi:EamA family transporter [Azonexus sp.]|uniref:EamA family transporter n=1 Tax=Azonexus sp. TaxID=1872668 RepID=UPI0035AF2F6B